MDPPCKLLLVFDFFFLFFFLFFANRARLHRSPYIVHEWIDNKEKQVGRLMISYSGAATSTSTTNALLMVSRRGHDDYERMFGADTCSKDP